MSKEKKLKKYAEDRLSDYAGVEDSLSRLQEAQRERAPEKTPVPWRRYAMRIATSLSVLVVVVVAAILAAQGFFGGGMSADSAKEGENVYDLAPAESDRVKNAPSQGSSKDMVAGNAASSLNAETEHIEVVLPADASIEKVEREEGYYYTLSLRDGSLDAIIAFDGAEISDAFDSEKESTVAGQTIEYAWAYDIALRGKIATDCETIYITHCAGEDEADALDALRTVFTEK